MAAFRHPRDAACGVACVVEGKNCAAHVFWAPPLEMRHFRTTVVLRVRVLLADRHAFFRPHPLARLGVAVLRARASPRALRAMLEGRSWRFFWGNGRRNIHCTQPWAA